MREIGIIYSKNKIKDLPEYIRVTDDIDEFFDNKLPKMIIGYENAKKNISDFSIIKKRYGDIFWTFGKTEKRNVYEKDLDDFYNTIRDEFIKGVDYKYINVLLITPKCLLRAYHNNNSKECSVLETEKTIYIKVENIIYGLNKDMVEYCGYSFERVMKMLENIFKTCKKEDFKIIKGVETRFNLCFC